jgi:hypothetical protein
MYIIKFFIETKLFGFKDSRGPTVFGTMQEVCNAAVKKGIEFNEVKKAFEDMATTGNNVADFGVRKTFMFTIKE